MGRASDRERLERALRDDARVTLLGPPGVGKSALAKLLAVPRLLWVRAPRAPWRDLMSDVLIAAGLGGVEHHGAWPSVLRERARFDLLPPIHASATRKMQRWGLAIEANRLHTAHFVEVARRHAQDAAADWPALHADRDNLQTAFEAALRLRKQAQVAALARALDLLRVTAGEANAHRDLLERSVAALRDAGLPDERAQLLQSLGRFHALRGRHTRAAVMFEEASQLDTKPGRLGWSHALSAFSLRALHRFDEAERALRVAEGCHDDPRLACMAAQSRGLLGLERGDAAGALPFFERALALALLHDAPRLAAIARANLGLAELQLGNLDAASSWLDAAELGFAAIDDHVHLACVALERGRIALARGELDLATQHLEHAEANSRARDALATAATARIVLARVAFARADTRAARLQIELARVLAAQVDERSVHLEIEALALPTQPVTLQLSGDGDSLHIGARYVDLRRRGPLRRLLLALARHRCSAQASRGLTALELLEAGWPGERPLGDSGMARVYVAVRRLRALGLGELLQTRDEGYALDPSTQVRWMQPTLARAPR